MTSDYQTADLVLDVLDALERHGHVRSDDYHVGRAHTHEDTQDHPTGAQLIKVPSCLPDHAGHHGPGRADTITLAGTGISTVVAPLDIAAACKRAPDEMCADCDNQSCSTCQTRHQDAQAYDRLAAQILQAAEARAGSRGQPEPRSRILLPGQADPAPGIEAGQ